MERTSFEGFGCSVARTLELVGEWWTPLIVRDLLLGLERFDELQRDLGMASNVLSARLKRLLEHGVIERAAAPDDARAWRYRLTERGRDLYPVLLALMAWGDKWRCAPGRQPMYVVHQRCGRVTAAVPHCSVCGEVLAFDAVSFEPGPGGRDGPGTAVIASRLRV